MTLVILVAGLVGFSVLHSLLAADRVRDWIRARTGLGSRGYRLTYNVLAIALLAATLLATPGPHPIIWRTQGLLRILLLSVQAVALVGFLWTLQSFDVAAFAGLRPPLEPRSATGAPGEPVLQTRGAYALCRHPLYFFAALLLSALPTMDLRWLVICLWVWVYADIGSRIEERRLEREFGAAYRRYQATHHRLLPLGMRGR